MLTSAPRGTKDILPGASRQWQAVEARLRDLCRRFAYEEIRTPVFEHTELFLRGIGETTDVVEKEMYTFQDRGERSITLRPENTASAVRAYLENKLYADPQPSKLYYIGPMFRYDRPQAGRQRQFHQFGIEAIGAQSAIIDAEVITLAVTFFQELGLKDLHLAINSVGCPQCRPVYRQKLTEFLADRKEQLCPDCQSRFDRNPLRILDCKNENCQKLSQGAPHMVDCLCEDCHDHFEELKSLLTAAGISYDVNPRLVRGLDYYTKTAFEIQYAPLGSQSAVCGGGRYDGLVEQIGGNPTPGIGLAIGLERVMLALEKQANQLGEEQKTDVYVAILGKKAEPAGFAIAIELRKQGLKVETDYLGRSLKAQMKQANRLEAPFVVLLGDSEVEQGQAQVKNMATGEQQNVCFDQIAAVVQG